MERGLSAAQVVKDAARLMGGGGGGRDTMAQAGGRDAGKLERGARGGTNGDRGKARLDCPRPRARLRQRALRLRGQRPDRHPRHAAAAGRRPGSEPGLRAIAGIVQEQEACGSLVGLPVSLSGEEGPQAAETREFAAQLRAAVTCRSRPRTSASRPGWRRRPPAAIRGLTRGRAPAPELARGAEVSAAGTAGVAFAALALLVVAGVRGALPALCGRWR